MKTRTRIFFLTLDVFSMIIAMSAAIWLRFETFSNSHVQYAGILFLFSIPSSIFVFWIAGLYNRTLLFTSIPDLMAVFNAVTITSMLKMTFIYFHQEMYFSRAILVVDWVLNLLLLGGSRVAPRIVLDVFEIELFRTLFFRNSQKRGKRVLIFGAGRAGESVLREIRRNENLNYDVIGFIDDDVSKSGQIIHGTKILGTRKVLNKVLAKKRVDEIIIAIPSAPGKVIREIVKLFCDKKVRFKTIPGLQDMLDGKFVGLQLRDIAIDDLLRRPPAEINLAEIAAYTTDKVILCTGGGGSIGGEICKQILPFKPKKLLLLGHGENSVFQAHQNLIQQPEVAGCEVVPIIADVQDRERLVQVFATHHPQIVFHAAAHKHVPLMESNPEEAVKNNILGTQNLVSVCHDFKTERVVMISTDKAVNPTSVMGATKRVAEMVLKAFAKRSPTRFVAVRFGNVLDSRGSVIPIFKTQIERGGPIKVTHPNMIRYFMTIPEASKLVIQAGAYGKGGEVFLLDMGEPVRIVDLATDLIRLSGLEVGKDVSIEFSGVRPGEKLFEELLTAEEGVTATHNRKIFIAKSEDVDEEFLVSKIQFLATLSKSGKRRQILEVLKSIVPSFLPDRDRVFNDREILEAKSSEWNSKSSQLRII